MRRIRSTGARDPRNEARLTALDTLNDWRNAIAHQSFDPGKLGGRTSARLSDVRRFRRICNALAGEFDAVIRDHLTVILGVPPW